MRLLLMNSFGKDIQLALQFKSLQAKCPALFKSLLARSYGGSDDATDDTGDSFTDGPLPDADHKDPLVIGRLTATALNGLPRKEGELHTDLGKGLRDAYLRDYNRGVSFIGRNNPINWWKKLSFTTRYVSVSRYIIGFSHPLHLLSHQPITC
jgi:hypothetical protein